MEAEMVDRRHRTSMSGIKVQEASAWGVNKAVERYGRSKYLDGPPLPKDAHAPQAPEDKQGPSYRNDHPNDWVRAANEDATKKPGFDKGRK
jgi:hypothetical protein